MVKIEKRFTLGNYRIIVADGAAYGKRAPLGLTSCEAPDKLSRFYS